MSPELHARKPYSGQQADLFALGIIMFILHTGHPPFNKANISDTHYKPFKNNSTDSFWKLHSRYQKGGCFSKQFIDLMNQMMEYEPTQRLDIADLLGHEWLNGEMATEEEVKTEFRSRHQLILKKKEAEQKQKDLMRGQRRQQDLLLNRGEEEVKAFGLWDKSSHKNTEFFSTYKPSNIFEDISALLKANDIKDVKIDHKKWKLSFDVMVKQKPEPLEEEETQHAEE